jgi:hypothetical protein
VSLTIANYGISSLSITNIQVTGTHFEITSAPSLPIELTNVLDEFSISIAFTPTEPGEVIESLNISSNDPVNPVKAVALTGNGYFVNPALTGILYASTGTNSNGKILSVNKNTGTGEEIGNSNFEEINSITISPESNIMYGAVTNSMETEIVRVNAQGGDSYSLFSLDLGLIMSIAFDTSGTLYGATNTGDIYTIDLSDGNYNFVIDAAIDIISITFDPVTNELWASPRIVFGPTKDKIYKIDLATGDASLIGETGFDVTTNDLAFDENGTLYGIIGDAAEVGELITISTTDAAGSSVGQIGFSNVLGLAYSIAGNPAGIRNETDDSSLPTEYVLSQNYPNPFNPTTLIEFSIPVESDVTLTVFNLLGQAIAELVNEEISAGNYSVVWNGEDQSGYKVSSGVYLYKIQANGTNGKEFQQIRKMVLLK